MKTMKPGSQLYRLMCLLSVAGEYPVKSLHLLGNKRMYRKLVKEGLSPLTVRNSVTGETLSRPRLFNLCGRGKLKIIRLYAGGEILPHNLPKLQIDRRAYMIDPGSPFFLTSRAIKQIGGDDNEANKTNFTRMVGGLFAGNDCYCVFNTRDSV